MPTVHDPEVAAGDGAEGRFAILPAVAACVTRARADMTDAPETPPSSFADEIAVAYRAHYALMEYVVARKFGVPNHDVADVIHEVVLAFMRARGRVENERAWLVGAACNACRAYWRKRSTRARESLFFEQPETSCDPVDVARRVDMSSILRRIPRRCRTVLHLRFYEEYSSEQLAAHFGTTVAYARKMVHRCVSAARALLAGIGRPR